MPLVYADTSALFAYFHPDDEFSAMVDAAVQTHLPDFVYWPFLRFGWRHHLRLTPTPIAMERWRGGHPGRLKKRPPDCAGRRR